MSRGFVQSFERSKVASPQKGEVPAALLVDSFGRRALVADIENGFPRTVRLLAPDRAVLAVRDDFVAIGILAAQLVGAPGVPEFAAAADFGLPRTPCQRAAGQR